MEIDRNIPAVKTGAANIDPLLLPELADKRLQCGVLRLDKIHPVISGNKWFKLKYHLYHALQNKHNTIITYGGSYSNHIIATACACFQQGISSVGIIRGEEPAQLSGTLQAASAYGMQLLFVSREVYAQKEGNAFIETLISRYSHPYIIPEGGSGEQGIRGCREILQLADTTHYTHIMCCIGTGAMYTGLAHSLSGSQQLIGIPVLKLSAQSYILQSLNRLSEEHRPGCCRILPDYHFGGYARKTPQLFRLMNSFYEQTGIPTDFVYTGKLIAAFWDLVKTGYFPEQSNILLVHSGGLQGNASLPPQTLIF